MGISPHLSIPISLPSLVHRANRVGTTVAGFLVGPVPDSIRIHARRHP
jgi:hypothetical protein